MREIESQVASTREALAQESVRTIAVLRSDYENAQSTLASLETDLEMLEERTTRTNASLVGLRDLERDAEATRSVFNSYLERERDLREQEAIAAESMTLVTEARPPGAPVGLRPLFFSSSPQPCSAALPGSVRPSPANGSMGGSIQPMR